MAFPEGHFEKAYGKGKFELVEVADLAVEGALDDAVRGCDGVAHVASNLSLNPDPNVTVTSTLAFVNNALESAIKEPKIKRFVYCSSSSAANQLIWNEPYDINDDTWNEGSVAAAWAPPPYTPERTLHVYNASKDQGEQAFWKFIKECKPGFVGNTVLPDVILGLPLNPAKQGLGPTATMCKTMWDDDASGPWKLFYPQWVIDIEDTTLLHVAGLVHPELKGERIMGYAHNKRWTDFIQRLQKMYPEHKFPDPPENDGTDMANVVNKPKAEAALKWLGRPGWTPLEQSLRTIFDGIRDGVGSAQDYNYA